MIEDNNSAESSNDDAGIQIPFDAGAILPPQVADIIKPNGLNVLLRLDHQPTMIGGLHLPQTMKSLEFITASVLAKGPECKFIQVGNRVLVARKAIINGEAGIPLEGVKLYFTQENLIVAIVG